MLRRKTIWLPLFASAAVVASFMIGCTGDMATTPSSPASSNSAPTNSTGDATGAIPTETVDQTASSAAAAGEACTLTVEGMT